MNKSYLIYALPLFTQHANKSNPRFHNMKKTTNIHFYKAMKHSHRISHLGLLKGVDNFNAKPNVDQQQSTALNHKFNKIQSYPILPH